jgi:SET domain-containing protein
MNNNPIGMKKFFNELGLIYSSYLTFDQNDLYTQRHIQDIKDLSENEIECKKLYADKINYKGYVDKKKPLLEVLHISEYFGYGVFAGQDFDCCDFVGEFCGIVTSNYDPSAINYKYNYFSAVNEIDDIFIAPRKIGNELQFVNHSDSPNVEWKTIVGYDNKYHVIMVATRKIDKGEQILVDYGKEYWEVLGINPVDI